MRINYLGLLLILMTHYGWGARYYEPLSGRYINTSQKTLVKLSPYQYGLSGNKVQFGGDDPVPIGPFWGDWIYAPVLVPFYNANQSGLSNFEKSILWGSSPIGGFGINSVLLNGLLIERMLEALWSLKEGGYKPIRERLLEQLKAKGLEGILPDGLCCAPEPDSFLDDLVNSGIIESWEVEKKGEIVIHLVEPDQQIELEKLFPGERFRLVYPEE